MNRDITNVKGVRFDRRTLIKLGLGGLIPSELMGSPLGKVCQPKGFLPQFFPFPGPGNPPSGGGGSTALITSVNTTGTDKNNFTGCLGFSFTVGASNIIVTDLGRWVISGNSGSHTVYLLDITPTVLASVSVNTSGATVGQFLYASITPVTLNSATNYYLLSSETNAGDHWYDDDNTTVTLTSDGTVIAGNYQSSCSGGISSDITGHVYVPVNLKSHH